MQIIFPKFWQNLNIWHDTFGHLHRPPSNPSGLNNWLFYFCYILNFLWVPLKAEIKRTFPLECKRNLNVADNLKIYFTLNLLACPKCFDLIETTFYRVGYKFHFISVMLHDNQRSFFIATYPLNHKILGTSNMKIWNQFQLW